MLSFQMGSKLLTFKYWLKFKNKVDVNWYEQLDFYYDRWYPRGCPESLENCGPSEFKAPNAKMLL